MMGTWIGQPAPKDHPNMFSKHRPFSGLLRHEQQAKKGLPVSCAYRLMPPVITFTYNGGH